MQRLAKASNTIDIIQRYDFVFQKKFGQNFLVDTHVLSKIVDAAQIDEEDVVIEIGPGIGSLTQELLERARLVIAIEIDRKLIPILEENLASYDNLLLINEDVLKLDLETLIREHAANRRVKLVANLPYYISTPIIMELLEKRLNIADITVMLQKELALRMRAKVGSKQYGAPSLVIDYFTESDIVANVPRNCFIPRPNVDSAVLHLKKRQSPKVEVEDEELMFKLVRASFNQRRKTLQNGLSNSAELNFSKEFIAHAIERAGFDLRIRGEELSIEDFARLANIFSKGI